MPKVKIEDFDTSKLLEKGQVQWKLIGPSYYIAPEVLKKALRWKMRFMAVWSIMNILLSGRPTFGADNSRTTLDTLKHQI